MKYWYLYTNYVPYSANLIPQLLKYSKFFLGYSFPLFKSIKCNKNAISKQQLIIKVTGFG